MYIGFPRCDVSPQIWLLVKTCHGEYVVYGIKEMKSPTVHSIPSLTYWRDGKMHISDLYALM